MTSENVTDVRATAFQSLQGGGDIISEETTQKDMAPPQMVDVNDMLELELEALK